MKRINPQTNVPFKMGDVRDDGYIFWGYESMIKKDGYFGEAWRDPVKFAAARKRSAERKKADRLNQHGRMQALLHSSRHSSKKRGHDQSELSVELLNALWDRQQGLCAYTGWPMSFDTKSENLVSIERINNDIGYTQTNVVLVCWCVNRSRREMTQSRFFEMCKAVTEHCVKDALQ